MNRPCSTRLSKINFRLGMTFAPYCHVFLYLFCSVAAMWILIIFVFCLGLFSVTNLDLKLKLLKNLIVRFVCKIKGEGGGGKSKHGLVLCRAHRLTCLWTLPLICINLQCSIIAFIFSHNCITVTFCYINYICWMLDYCVINKI